MRAGIEAASQTHKGLSIAKAIIATFREQCVLLPAVNMIERMGLAARAIARRRAESALIADLSDEKLKALDILLDVDPAIRQTRFSWLRSAPDAPDMFREFASRIPGMPLVADMTELGKTPFFTASEFEEIGYRMVIWPVSSLRVANKAQVRLYTTLKSEGLTKSVLGDMQTRAELYDAIGLADYEALDASIVKTIVPESTSV